MPLKDIFMILKIFAKLVFRIVESIFAVTNDYNNFTTSSQAVGIFYIFVIFLNVNWDLSTI